MLGHNTVDHFPPAKLFFLTYHQDTGSNTCCWQDCSGGWGATLLMTFFQQSFSFWFMISTWGGTCDAEGTVLIARVQFITVSILKKMFLKNSFLTLLLHRSWRRRCGVEGPVQVAGVQPARESRWLAVSLEESPSDSHHKRLQATSAGQQPYSAGEAK